MFDVCNQVKHALECTDKSFLKSQKCIRRKPGWTDAIGDFFRPSEETKDKTKEMNTSESAENKEGMRLRRVFFLLFIVIYFLYIKLGMVPYEFNVF